MWIRELHEQGRCLWLFLSLMGLFLLYPYLETSTVGHVVLGTLYSLTCLLAVWVAARSRRQMVFAIVTAAPVVPLSWIALVRPDAQLGVITWISFTCFFLGTMATMFGYVARSGKVTRDKIYGGISVYLLIGLTFFAIYSLKETLSPGSFNGLSETPMGPQGSSDLLYFSFVTLTTLGYGEITPATSNMRSLAILEAICGVLFIATFVARLVAMYQPNRQ